jgi:arginine/lysine/ornithine decarboxylase
MLMAAADYTLQLLWENPSLFEAYVQRLTAFRSELESQTETQNSAVTLLPCENADPSKLLFYVNKDLHNSAENIATLFANKYKVQAEMAKNRHILAMTSVADTDEGFERLIKAVRGVNGAAPEGGTAPLPAEPVHRPLAEVVLSPRAAMRQPTEVIPLSAAAGRICGELVAPCPPGIALLAPGERIPPGLTLERDKICVIRTV